MTGSEIQATGTVEFEDGILKGDPSKARNSLHRVCTRHEINAFIDSRGRMDQVIPWAYEIPILLSNQ